MWHDSVLGTIGNTPLVRLNRLTMDLPCTVLAKVEFFNPGGSVKDRIAQSMIDAAEAEGRLQPGGTIIEGTSGNTGAGLALVAIAKGYRCIFTTTDKQSQEKVDVLRALGAEVIVCPNAVEPTDPRSYYSVARRLADEIPNSVYLNQYDNPANAEAHFKTTGPELWAQTEGRITHYIAGAGTGGTISGTARYLKAQNPDLKVIGVDPYGSVYYKYFHSNGEFDHNEIYPYLTEGVGEDIIAQNMDFHILDDYVRVRDKAAMQMTRRLAREEGLFVGQSCGMAVAGALQWLQAHKDELTADDVVVVVLPDSGFRYLSKTYNDTWMRDHGFLERRTDITAAQILAHGRSATSVVSVTPSDTVEHAVQVMAEHEISQMPVIDAQDHVVGSLNENGLLNKLIENPAVREQTVDHVMGEPLAIVPRGLHLDMLTAYLDEGPGAVLVEPEGGDGFAILTRSDLIRALAKAGRSRN